MLVQHTQAGRQQRQRWTAGVGGAQQIQRASQGIVVLRRHELDDLPLDVLRLGDRAGLEQAEDRLVQAGELGEGMARR
jgi:hypothetical protein